MFRVLIGVMRLTSLCTAGTHQCFTDSRRRYVACCPGANVSIDTQPKEPLSNKYFHTDMELLVVISCLHAMQCFVGATKACCLHTAVQVEVWEMDSCWDKELVPPTEAEAVAQEPAAAAATAAAAKPHVLPYPVMEADSIPYGSMVLGRCGACSGLHRHGECPAFEDHDGEPRLCFMSFPPPPPHAGHAH